MVWVYVSIAFVVGAIVGAYGMFSYVMGKAFSGK